MTLDEKKAKARAYRERKKQDPEWVVRNTERSRRLYADSEEYRKKSLERNAARYRGLSEEEREYERRKSEARAGGRHGFRLPKEWREMADLYLSPVRWVLAALRGNPEMLEHLERARIAAFRGTEEGAG